MRDCLVPHSAHIYAVNVVNHLWKAIKKAHILSEDLIETTKYHKRTEYFPSLELNHEPKELGSLVCSPQFIFTKTDAEHLHLLYCVTYSGALPWKAKGSVYHAYHSI